MDKVEDTSRQIMLIVHFSFVGQVQRKLQYAIPDQGAWGEAFNYEIFVQGGAEILSSQVM